MRDDSRPFRQFVLKVHSRCDLACDHCYVYEHADQSWRGRPRELDAATAAQVAERIAEHAAAHRLPEVRIVLHGGEPLLLGVRRMRETLAVLRTRISPTTTLDLRIHTNAVGLTEDFLDLFAEYDVKIGVSLDGDRAANDRHRVFRDGRGSHDLVVTALALLRQPRYRHLYAGLLCTIDIANEPIDVYRGLLAQEPPRIDLLLPHATWERQPTGLVSVRNPDDPTTGEAEYATWLGAVFEAWDADGRPVPVRIFESMIGALHGRPSTTEALGLDPVDLLVIETDGTVEQVDSLKTAYEGAAETGLDVWQNSLDEASAIPGIAARRRGIGGVSAVCGTCEVVQVCGGGLYPHRYRSGHGFDNPSVYCADLKQMITRISDVEARRRSGRLEPACPVAPAPPAPADASDDDSYDGLDLPAANFAELAAGYGSASTVRILARNQAALQRDLVALTAREGPPHDQRFAAAWDLLVTLSRSAPEAVATVLAHPYTRVWAVKLLTDLRRGAAVPADVLHLEAVAASAAVHARHDARVRVPSRGDVAPLPGIGALAAGSAPVWCDAGAADGPHLVQPLRRIDAAGLHIMLEDTDPYRSCHGQPSDRLDAAEADRWARALSAAITYLDDSLPAFAPGLRAGLTTIVPMRNPADGSQRSSASRDAFGSIAVSLPEDPALLALLLVHEFQHVKLGALLDIAELCDDSSARSMHYAPWRSDPRPLEGLLQGTYAHIAVVEFWRVRREQVARTERGAADLQFARWRLDTTRAVDQLEASKSLTALGELVVSALRNTVDSWTAAKVDHSTLSAAKETADRHHAEYRARFPVSAEDCLD